MKQLYLDTDDEITAIISKIESISSETIAIIPPKRSTTLQSVVNLKLLKKAADKVGSKLVIITRDAAILNVASQLKLLTAPNLETDPAVPEPATSAQEMPSATIDGTEPTEADFKSADTATSGVNQTQKDKKGKKSEKQKKVPDFNRFKKRILIALGILLLIGIGIWAFFNLLPAAAISIEGRTQAVDSEFTMYADPTIEASDIENGVLAAQSQQLQRTITERFEATGERTVGERATGEVTITNCEVNEITIEEGTALTAANGLVYRTQATVSINPSDRQAPFNLGDCQEDEFQTVSVQADSIGEDYNIGPTSYSVSGYNPDAVFGSGGNMTGGSEEDETFVSEEDVERAREELLEGEQESAEEELRQDFDDELFVIEASFEESIIDETVEPEIGEEADEGRLILQVNFTLLAVDHDEMEELLEMQHLLTTEETDGLAALETGIEDADISAADDEFAFLVSTSGVLGPDLDIEETKQELAGEPYLDAIDYIESYPNVTRVQIDLDPFWASNLPNNPDRIEIEFDMAGIETAEDDE